MLSPGTIKESAEIKAVSDASSTAKFAAGLIASVKEIVPSFTFGFAEIFQ